MTRATSVRGTRKGKGMSEAVPAPIMARAQSLVDEWKRRHVCQPRKPDMFGALVLMIAEEIVRAQREPR